jgi:hypothetical protein
MALAMRMTAWFEEDVGFHLWLVEGECLPSPTKPGY